MRRLAQPEVLKSAATAALLTALLSCPQLMFWTTRRYPLWYIEAVLFVCSIVLWSFVFAWHTEYTKRPAVTLKVDRRLFALATLAGLGAGVSLWFGLDPTLRLRLPENYPTTFDQWLAKALFSLAFLQLFLTFAPFAWLMRLSRNRTVAFVLTVLLGVTVLALQSRSSKIPVPAELFAAQLIVRVILGSLSLWFYLRGGVLLAWWWGLLVESRHLLGGG